MAKPTDKKTAFMQAMATGCIAVTEKTSTILLHMSQMEELADLLSDELSEDDNQREEIYSHISPLFYEYMSAVRDELAHKMAENLSFRDFHGL